MEVDLDGNSVNGVSYAFYDAPNVGALKIRTHTRCRTSTQRNALASSLTFCDFSSDETPFPPNVEGRREGVTGPAVSLSIRNLTESDFGLLCKADAFLELPM